MTKPNVTYLPPPPELATTNTPPHDDTAEQVTLGAMLLNPRIATEIATTLDGTDFWQPRHETIYDAARTLILTGQPADPITVTNTLTPQQLTTIGGPAYIHELAATVPTTENGPYYAQIVRDHADTRRALKIATALHQRIIQRGDTPLQDVLEQARTELENTPTGATNTTTAGQNIDDFLAGADDDYDWLIEGFLERQDRLILTAGEGVGKSTLLRQWAVQTAAGIHPTSGQPMHPRRVLVVDLENSRRQTRRKLRPMRIQAGDRLDPTNLIIECKTDGLDLTSPESRTWLDQVITHHQPDVLITGPVYKMAGGDTDKEVDQKPVALYLDKLRTTHDLAIILEAHSRKGDGGTHRPKEPFGWSGWMRWPEFGIHLGDEGQITHWRGLRDERTFPHQMNRGGTWPFEPLITLAEQRWDHIRAAIQTAGRALSVRELEAATSIPKSSVQEIVKEHKYQIDQLVRDLTAAADGDGHE